MNLSHFCIVWMLLMGCTQLAMASAPATNQGPQDKAALEAFIDGAWHTHKQRHAGAGAVVTFVKDGEVWLNKGYGYADLASLKPVDPTRTLFRIASISKPFTWIAAMQLFEQGKLDLDADLNTYLQAFQLPAMDGVPITMRHLMSHNAGFEDVVIDLGRRRADELLPLGEHLKENLPEQVRPAGLYSSYSNHSTAIAAHVIEAISGLDWSTYIEQNLLTPARMQRTVARHPMPTTLGQDLASAYRRKGGAWDEHDFLHWMIYPAGMMSTTGSDMARFIQLQLAGGPPLLQRATYQQMLEPIFRPFPEANAWLHGYVDRSRNGVRMYGHGGDLNGFHSELVFFPDHNMGLFVAVNTDPGESFGYHLLSALLDRHFHVPPPQRDAPNATQRQANRDFHGQYSSLRRSFSDFAKLILLVDYTTIDSNEAGYLTVSSGGAPQQFVPIDTDQFIAREGHHRLRFVRDAAGSVTHMHGSGYAASTQDRLTGWDNPIVHRALYAFVALSALVFLVLWPIRSYQARRHPDANRPSLITYASGTILSAGLLYSFFALVNGLQNTEDVMFGIPDHMVRTLVFSGVLACACILFGIHSVYVLATASIRRVEQAMLAIFTFATTLYVWLCHYWNILAFMWS